MTKKGGTRHRKTNEETQSKGKIVCIIDYNIDKLKDCIGRDEENQNIVLTIFDVVVEANDELKATNEAEDLIDELRNDIDNEDLLNMEIPPMPEPVMSSDGTGNRLMITSIEVENFKSYYGKQVIGPFHQNFTSIIGPNGSGKSNVIDSLLFVFGYRAAKLRSAKLSILIHSSASHENLQSCSVAVNFQKIVDLPDGGYTVVPGSQFKITRTAYKDNSSRYFYNGKGMQFKEIAKLLRQVGIDLIHNRFLILQGEVEQIALMKPKAQNENDNGMLEYLEDIIGSSRLKIPLEKLAIKIEELQEQRTSQLSKVKYAEKEKNDSEGKAVTFIAEMRIDNAITIAKNQLYSVEKLKAVKNVNNLKIERDKKVEELNAMKLRQKEIFDLQENRKHENSKFQKSYEIAQEEFELLKTKMNGLEQATKKRQIEKLRFEDRIKKLSDEMKKEEKKVDECMKKFENETADSQEKKKALEEELGDLKLKEDEACSKLTLAQEALQILRLKEENENKKVLNLQTRLKESEELLDTKKKETANARKALPNLESELLKKKSELTETQKLEANCIENIRNFRNKYEQKIQTAEAFKSQNVVLNRIMSEKKCGRLPGVFGRLGDLGGIEKKYDVAISTTCGALDYIVVDSIDTAQQCVNFLKKERLGLATFIALDKQEHLKKYMQKPESTPEQVPRLFDLITVTDPKVLPAFYYALRETLVANDIATATRVGLGGAKRYRVVTLKGEVVEASGLMSGGGRSERRGRIGQNVKVDTSKDSGVEIKELEQNLKKEETRLGEIRISLQQIQRRIQVLESDCSRIRSNLEFDFDTLEKEVRSLKETLKMQMEKAKNAATDDDALRKAKSDVERLEKNRDAATEAADALRERVHEVADVLQKAYDSLVGGASRELNALKEKKETAVKGISKERATLNSSQRNLNKAKTRKADLEVDYNEAANTIERLKNEEEQSATEISSIREQKLISEEKMKKAEETLKEAIAKNNELDGEDAELKKQLGDCSRDLKEQEQILDAAKHKVASVDQKISALSMKYVKCIDRFPDAVKEGGIDDDDVLKKALELEKDFFERVKTGDAEEYVSSPLVSSKVLPVYTEEQIGQFDSEEAEFNIKNLEKRKAGKGININDLEEYIKKLDRYEHELEILNVISLTRDKHRQLYQQLRKQRMTEFMEGFTQIGVLLKEMYQMITLGGNASLDLVDSLDPFSEGVSFGVRPPKKSWKQISNLSGGEKTLASLALVFALHHYRPTPLYIMDEIDAALDFRNVSIIGHYVKERTKNAQFIIISLRNNMFELADRLIGIYKTFDCTKNVAIDPKAVRENMIRFRSAIEESRQRNNSTEESVVA
uniref:Structural maintenance of chromosomes protein n=1 Tax=Syphacia muris TaxID=451379 RepID=A0A0N5AHP7_9BILA